MTTKVAGQMTRGVTRYVGSVAELGALSLADGTRVDVTQFWPDTGAGFGQYEWQESRDKTEHTGVTVIDPDKLSELGSLGTYGTYFTPATSGTGCFVLIGTPTIYNAGAVDDPNASNAEAINAAIQDGARGVPVELEVSAPIVLPSERVYFDNLKITAAASFTGDYIIDTTDGMNFEDLHVSANNQLFTLLDRDATARLSSGYFKNLTLSDTPQDSDEAAAFRAIDNLEGRNLTLRNIRHRDAVRARDCKDGEVIGVRSIDCGARTATISDESENFFLRNIVITGDVQNTGAADGGAHLYTSGEFGTGIVNCGFSDVYINSPVKEAILVKFSRNSQGCSLVGARGIMRSGTGFNGAVTAQGSPDSIFRNIDIHNTQEDNTGTASLLFCRPHPTTGTQSSGTKFVDVRVTGFVGGVEVGAKDTGGAAGTIEDITFKNVYVKTAQTAFGFTGGSYLNFSVKDCEFISTGGRALNTDFAEMGTVTNGVFENVTMKTEAATEAARFPTGMEQILRCTFERVRTAGEDVAWAQTGDGIVAHNVFKGGTVLYSGTGTLAGNFNVVIDA